MPGPPKKRRHPQTSRSPKRREREREPLPVAAPSANKSKKHPKIAEVDWDDLLKSVSRSFYLSIRFLPKSLRPGIGLAYLLARASDTIADSTGGSNADRIQLLHSFLRMVKVGPDAEWQDRITSGVAGKIDDSDEKHLVEKLPQLIKQLDALPEADRQLIVRVLLRILFAQETDLKNFPGKSKPTAIESAEKLDEYTYFIAGCVGEFWTRMCRLKEPDFSDVPDEKLLPLAVRFGKGLQLVNILRDLPNDLKHGRCYLPADELAEAGVTVESLRTDPKKAADVVKRWMKEAQGHLEAGWQYVQSMKNLRVRYACAIPILIGMKTLSLMQKNPPLLSKEKIKVPRSEVKMILLKAGVGTLVGPFLQQTYRGIQRQLS